MKRRKSLTRDQFAAYFKRSLLQISMAVLTDITLISCTSEGFTFTIKHMHEVALLLACQSINIIKTDI